MSQTTRIPNIALIGNPNTGKSTIFNNLTGLRQKTGNYPGVTVSKTSGKVQLSNGQTELIDLPGSYSLAASSLDERITIDVLNGRVAEIGKPDLVVCIADASNLRRNLYLVSQVATLDLPIVLVLNQWDFVKKSGLEIDLDLLEERLGIPVVPCVGRSEDGIRATRNAIEKALTSQAKMNAIEFPESIEKATLNLIDAAKNETGRTLLSSEAHRLLFDVNSSEMGVFQGHEEAIEIAIGNGRKSIREDGLNPMAAEALLHYKYIDKLLDGVISKVGEISADTTQKLDRFLLHRGLGLVFFTVMMYIVFQAVYSWSGPIMDIIESVKLGLQGWAEPIFANTPMFQSLVCDGVIEGVGAFLIFLPQILVLFFFISLLEESGYMARAAFLMDKVFSWCGLNGKSFVPLLSSYACAVPGILGARTIEDNKTRLATIFIAPFMSCSARLPVYILLIGAFVEPVYGAQAAGLTLFAMHFVGLLVAVPTAFVLNRFILKAQSQPFVMELPKYRKPLWRDVFMRMYHSGIEFCKTAGTLIFLVTIIIWALSYFPRLSEQELQTIESNFIEQTIIENNDFVNAATVSTELKTENSDLAAQLDSMIASRQIEQSYIGRLGHIVQPIFEPAGFDWQISIGILASFPAREVIISTLGIIYNLGGDVDENDGNLRQALASAKWESGPNIGKPIFNIPVVIALMVFYALCSQCGATIMTIVKEANTRWAILSFFYMTGIAWIGAVLSYKIGMWFLG